MPFAASSPRVWGVALLATLLAVHPARAEVFDRVLVVIGEELVLQSEVSLEADLSTLDASALPFWSEDFGPPLDRLTDGAVIRSMAGQLTLYEPTSAEVAARLEALRLAFDTREAWQAFLDERGLTERSLTVFLHRRLVVERYLTRNIQASLEDREAWIAETHGLLTTLRRRFRIRRIPKRAVRGG